MTQSTSKKTANSGQGKSTGKRETAKAKSDRLERRIAAFERDLAFVEFDADEKIVGASEPFLGLTGHKLESILGDSHRSLLAPVDAADPEYGHLWLQASRGEVAEGLVNVKCSEDTIICAEIRIMPVLDEAGDVVSLCTSFQDRSEEEEKARDAQALASMIQTASAMFMSCDRDLRITYVNPSVMQMLRKYEAEIQKALPSFDCDNIIGTCIDDFHVNPSHQRRLLQDERNLPAISELTLGPLTFGVNATALHDAKGNYIGNGVEWTDFNAREDYRFEVEKVAAAGREGRLEVRGDVERLDDVYRPMMASINGIIDEIVAPIHEASQVLESLANQDLTARMEGDYQGDHARTKDNLNRAIENLAQALQQVNSSAQQVSSASGQISEGSEKLAQGASTQASSIEEISASLEEMSSMTSQNASNADEATALSNAAQSAAERGNSTMKRMREAINGIKASSDETAKIVKTIDEIAFQTNLLALNAAVEAARAGDAGKGFAVVAEEVRSLAQRSAEAAKNTAELIDQAVKNAEGGVNISEEVRTILEEIYSGSTKVNDLITEIAAASKEQADGIGQINSSVDRMNHVTQENAANSEQSSAAVAELNGEVRRLGGLIGRFHLGASAPLEGAPMAAPAPMAAQPAHAAPTPPPALAVDAKSAFPLDDDFSDF